MPKRSSSQSGFTLLELVLALGIFSTILIILIGFYSRFVNQQRADILDQRMIENVRFALDLFSREARTAFGSTYLLSDSGGQGVIFRNQNGLCVHYRLTDDNIERTEVSANLPDCTLDLFSVAVYQPLISTDLRLISSRFDVTPAEVSGAVLTNQGYITLTLSATPRNQTTPPVTLQTTVSSRQVTPYTINP